MAIIKPLSFATKWFFYFYNIFITMGQNNKKTHIQKVNKLFEQRCLTETISASEAYRDYDALMTVVNGRRTVSFLLADEVRRYMSTIKKSGLKLMVIRRSGTGWYGDAYIVYSDYNDALHLKEIMDKKGGYLSHDTPEDAIENGEALQYHNSDIKTFVDKHFGVGAYDKSKNNYETAR